MAEAKFFEKAAEDVKKHVKSLSNEKMLELYGLYKQANFGDCNIKEPGMLDLKAKAKWKAWNALKGKDKEEAKVEYVKLVLALLPEEIKNEYK